MNRSLRQVPALFRCFRGTDHQVIATKGLQNSNRFRCSQCMQVSPFTTPVQTFPFSRSIEVRKAEFSIPLTIRSYHHSAQLIKKNVPIASQFAECGKVRYMHTGSDEVVKALYQLNETLKEILSEVKGMNRNNENDPKGQRERGRKIMSQVNESLDHILAVLNQKNKTPEAAIGELKLNKEAMEKLQKLLAEELNKLPADDGEPGEIEVVKKDVSPSNAALVISKGVDISKVVVDELEHLSEEIPKEEAYVILKSALKIANNPNRLCESNDWLRSGGSYQGRVKKCTKEASRERVPV